MRTERSEQQRAEHDGEHDHAARHHVLSCRVREKRHAVLVNLFLVSVSVRLAAHHATGHRPFVDADAKHEPEMQADHADEDPGNEKHVHREESRQRAPRDDRSAEQELDQRVSDARRARRDRGADPEPPVGVLIPAEDLTREGHAERAEKQEDADDPRELARVFVGAPEKDLDHVQRHDRDHRVGAPEMDRAQEPTERCLVVEIEQALIGAFGRGHVDESQADARRDLQHEERERRAAEDVPPARRAAWHRVIEGRRDRAAQARSFLQPGERRTDGPATVRAHTGLERVGSCPPRTQRAPSRTWYSYSNKPRGGGPEAREPSS